MKFATRLSRAVRVEFRKLGNTRGRAALLTLTAVLPGVLSVLIVSIDTSATPAYALNLGFAPAYVLAPMLAIVTIAGEYSQRTGLSTFAAEPWRLVVAVAKMATLLTFTIAVILLTTAATVASAAVWAGTSVWDSPKDLASALFAALVTMITNTLLASAIAFLLPTVAISVVIFLVFTASIDSLMSPFGEVGQALRYNAAVDALAAGNGSDISTLTPALLAWLVAPLCVGVITFTRRDVK